MDALILADLLSSLQQALHRLQTTVDSYIVNAFVKNGPQLLANFLGAVIIFFVGKWVARFGERILDRLLTNARVDETLTKFLCRITFALLMCAVALAALERLGVQTTSLTAVLAAAGLAVGLALQGSLSNFAAGVMIILFRPFKVGDLIEAAGTKGIVEEIHIFSTMMRTPDNVDIIVPNSAVTGGNITNYSSKPIRRIDLVVGCGYADDLSAVKQFLQQLVDEDPRIRRDPAPVVAVSELAESSVNFVVRPWVKNTDYWNVKWDLTERVKLGFDQHGFTIPFPQRDLHIRTDTAQPVAIDPVALAAADGNAIVDRSLARSAPPSPGHSTPTEPPLPDGLIRPRRAA
jgi:small conductance mechanosensitive channel